MWSAISSWFKPVIAKLFSIGSIAAIVGGILVGVRRSGRDAERLDQLKREIKDARVRKNIEVRNSAASSDPDAVRDRVRRQRDKIKRSL